MHQKLWALFALLLATLFLPACSDAPSNAHDFNELIPRMMGAIKNRTPEDAASNLFNVTNPDERRDAIAWLETKPYGHEDPYMKAYFILVTDPSPMVRAQAMQALGSSHQAVAVKYLVGGADGKGGLADKSVEVRRDAADGLCFTFTPEATPALANAVRSDSDDQVRIYAARALRSDPSPAAVRALIDALDDRDAGVVYYAHDSLKHSTHQDFGTDSKAWLRWYQTWNQPATKPTGQG
ncbi:MAG TPA: HEAT repeat domain-containing protein [Phycisphaerae bacterium]|nr:HEAT repeat domain-containing protein [Phycisphaerae bacterium]